MCNNGNGKACWEVNPSCQAKKLTKAEMQRNPCAAYEQKTDCWRVDRASQLKNKPEPEKGFWEGFYNIGCPNCPVCEHHQERVREMIENINEV